MTPREVLFLDDLGVNLKPARELGMRTIKVITADQALAELETLLGHKIGEGAFEKSTVEKYRYSD